MVEEATTSYMYVTKTTADASASAKEPIAQYSSSTSSMYPWESSTTRLQLDKEDLST